MVTVGSTGPYSYSFDQDAQRLEDFSALVEAPDDKFPPADELRAIRAGLSFRIRRRMLQFRNFSERVLLAWQVLTNQL